VTCARTLEEQSARMREDLGAARERVRAAQEGLGARDRAQQQSLHQDGGR
jgi:hypothetical protein